MKKLVLILALVITLTWTLTSCSSNQTSKVDTSKKDVAEIIKATNPEKLPEAAKKRKDTVIIGITAPSGKFAPISTGDLYDQFVCELVFDPLISNDASGNPIPNVAKEWKVSEDAKTYTFTLKKGIKFSDGQELTADDVAFTIKAVSDPNYDGAISTNVANIVGYDEYNKDKANKVKDVTGIKVIDKYTIEFDIKKPRATTIYDLGGIGIMPKHVYNFEKGNFQAVKDKFQMPLGSGAYVFKRIVPSQEIDFERNPNYFKGEPKIKNIIYKVTNANTSVQELTSGNVDIDIINKPENLNLVKNAGFFNIQSYPSNSYGYIGLNLRDPKFSDKKVRQALTYGLNRKGFVDAYYKGLADVCNVPISKVSWAYNTEVNQYEFNPQKANKLLDEAGWVKNKDGFRYKNGKKFTINWLTYTGSKYVESLIAIVKDNWGKLGIDVQPQLMEFGTLCSKVYDKQQFEMFNMGWSLTIDPDPSGIYSVTQDKLGGNNAVGWRSDESEKLINEGLATSDIAKRKEIYQKWCKVFSDEVPYILLDLSKDNYPVSCRIKGLDISPFRDFTYDLWKAEIDQ